MIYTYQVSTSIDSARVNLDRLTKEIEESSLAPSLERIDSSEDNLVVAFFSSVTVDEEIKLEAIIRNHSGEPLEDIEEVTKVHIGNTPAFSSNKTEDGKLLYLKIHGMKAVIPPNGSHAFLFTIPYIEAYLQGAEIFVDILAQTDMKIKHPDIGTLEQYGYQVCTGKVIYKRQSDYAAKLPMGLQVSATCFNTEDTSQEMGVNFVLHEIRSAE